MSDPHHFVACPECDALFTLPPLDSGHSAVCSRCGARLYTARPRALQRATAWSLAAATFFVIAVTFPFLSLESTGQSSQLHLAGSVAALAENGSPSLAAAVAVFILAAPAFMIAGTLYLSVPLLAGTLPPLVNRVAHLLTVVRQWNMPEVFLIGVLVSFLKLHHLSEITLGVSFYAFIATIVCLTASLASAGPRSFWHQIELATP